MDGLGQVVNPGDVEHQVREIWALLTPEEQDDPALADLHAKVVLTCAAGSVKDALVAAKTLLDAITKLREDDEPEDAGDTAEESTSFEDKIRALIRDAVKEALSEG